MNIESVPISWSSGVVAEGANSIIVAQKTLLKRQIRATVSDIKRPLTFPSNVNGLPPKRKEQTKHPMQGLGAKMTFYTTATAMPKSTQQYACDHRTVGIQQVNIFYIDATHFVDN